MTNPAHGVARRPHRSLFLAALVLAAGGLVAVLTVVRLPQYPADRAAAFREGQDLTALAPKDRLALEKDLLQYETDNRVKIWTALVQAFAGLVLLLGLVFTWLNLRATQAKLDVDREGQLTNRFTQAAGQLGAELKDGAPNVEVRLGGIYALARIAVDCPRDAGPIADILTAYVRYNAPWPRAAAAVHGAVIDPKPRTDVQAILTILGRGLPTRPKVDLRRTDLRGAEFWDARLEGTDFWGANLAGARLWGARLDGAKLENADLRGANLRGTRWAGAVLTGARLDGADLREADLTGVIGLTQVQFDAATNGGAGCVLPAGLTTASTGCISTQVAEG